MNGHIREIEEALKWAELFKQAGVAPPHLSVQQVAVLVLAGRDLGISPLQSLRSISLIQGQIALSVQCQLAVARRAGVKIAEIKESEDQCTITLARGEERVTATFTMQDAKRAGLGGRSWEKYPRLMLRARAIGSALRLIAPDVVLGLLSPEEAVEVAATEPSTESLPEEEAVEPIAEDIPGYLPKEPEEIEGIAEALQEEAVEAIPESPPEDEESLQEPIPESQPNDDEPRESAGGGLIDEERWKLIRRIHGFQSWLGWSDEIYREWLLDRFGVDSSKQLGIDQLVQAAKELQQEAQEELILRLGNLHPSWANPEVADLFREATKKLLGVKRPLEILASAESAQDIMQKIWEKMDHPQKFATGKMSFTLKPEDFAMILRKALS